MDLKKKGRAFISLYEKLFTSRLREAGDLAGGKGDLRNALPVARRGLHNLPLGVDFAGTGEEGGGIPPYSERRLKRGILLLGKGGILVNGFKKGTSKKYYFYVVVRGWGSYSYLL